MLDQNTTTLLSTFLGGILAILGGFLANIITHYMSDRSERRNFLRGKIEEVYLVLDDYRNMLERFQTDLLQCIINKSDAYMGDHEAIIKMYLELNALRFKAGMIVGLYLPDLEKSLEEYSNKIDEISSKRTKIANDIYNNEFTFTSGDVLKLTKEILKADKEIKAALSKAVKKRRYI